MDTLKTIGKNIREQDNRITDQPIFLVQQLVRDYGYDSAYADGHIWRECGDPETIADETTAERLDALDYGGRISGKWDKVGYCDRWEFVTACFTEKGCRDYLKINGHNLRNTRIYADGSHRNNEFRLVRKHLMELTND